MPFSFGTAIAEEAGFSGVVLSELGAYYDGMVAGGQSPGHVLLLVKGDDIICSHVTGFADWETKEPLRADSIFGLYSMSRPLAAVAMLLLYEEGQWALDDPVSRHLPEFADIALRPGSKSTRCPTIRETFTHTTGMSFGKTAEEVGATIGRLAWHEARSLDEMIGRYASEPLAFEPGTAWDYSLATDLQAAMVERMSGERYDLFLKRRVFGPLGMVDTGFVLDHGQTRRLARGHKWNAETNRLRLATADEQMEPIFPMGSTSFKSTARDYALLGRMLLNRGMLGETRILKAESVDLMLSNHLPDAVMQTIHSALHYRIGQGTGYGLNGMVCLDPTRAGRPVGKGTYEWGGAFGTWFWIDPEHDIICVGMTNRSRLGEASPPEVIAQELVYRALRKPPPCLSGQA